MSGRLSPIHPSGHLLIHRWARAIDSFLTECFSNREIRPDERSERYVRYVRAEGPSLGI